MTLSRSAPDAWTQADLFDQPGRAAPDLAEELSLALKRPIFITTTRNRVSMISIESDARDAIHIRMHEAFLSAPPDVLHALRVYISTHRKSAWAIVRDYAQCIPTQDRSRKPLPPLRTKGRVYDLRAIYNAVNEQYFSNGVSCRIGWGKASRHRPRRSIRYGSYQPDGNTIRVNPLLDDIRVPEAFLYYIVHHEMLHVIVPSEKRGQRCNHHPPQFKALEKRFPDLTHMESLSRSLLTTLSRPSKA